MEDSKTAIREKPPDTDRRHVNRPPRKKITVIVERGEEGDSQAAVRHGVQETMARGSDKEIHPRGGSTEAGRSSPKSYEQRSACHESSEEKRVRESAVAPEVTVPDAESEADYVKVRNHGADYPHDPDSLWCAWAAEAGAYAEGRNCM